MKFGDIVINKHASENNPHRVLMFTQQSGKYLYFLTMKGNRIKFYSKDRDIFIKVEEIDFSKWKKVASVSNKV